MEENDPTGTARYPRWMVALVIGFGLFHAASLLLAILPRGSALNEAFAPYRQLTGTGQQWEMFQTIPTMLASSAAVEVRDASGSVAEYGPILPGLKSYATHSRIRYYYLLNRLTSPGGVFLDAYLEKLRQAVAEGATGSPVEFTLRLRGDYIRLLRRIQEDGEMTLEKTVEHGPFLIEP